MTPDFDAVAWVGQHAKAGTPFAHLAHTSSMRVVNQRINNISVGEFGMSVFMGVVMGIQPIFGSGDLAFCKEAAALCPGMVAVSVKEGVIPGSGSECLTEEYRERNTAAIHLHPLEARRRIYEGAREAARRFVSAPEAFSVRPLEAPEEIIRTGYAATKVMPFASRMPIVTSSQVTISSAVVSTRLCRLRRPQ